MVNGRFDLGITMVSEKGSRLTRPQNSSAEGPRNRSRRLRLYTETQRAIAILRQWPFGRAALRFGDKINVGERFVDDQDPCRFRKYMPFRRYFDNVDRSGGYSIEGEVAE